MPIFFACSTVMSSWVAALIRSRAAVLLLGGWLLVQALPLEARLAGPLEVRGTVAVRDLAAIRASGQLRVLINQSRHSSGVVASGVIGSEYPRLRALVQQLNQQGGGERPIRLVLVPRPKEQLLAALLRGEGDLVAPGELLAVRRGQAVAISRPLDAEVPLVIVSHQGAPRLQRLEQLAGRSLALPSGSGARPALQSLNARLARPLVADWQDPSLAIEDVLELVQAGVLSMTAVELPIARRWAQVWPRLRIDEHLRLSEGHALHWFMHRQAPALRAAVDRFLRDYRPSSHQEATFLRTYRRLYKVHNPLGRTELQRLLRVRSTLMRQGEAQQLDWLLLAALAYKESTLNPAARGRGGVLGLVQVSPATARSVGVADPASLEGNVRAASLYLARLRQRFFAGSQFNERERTAFMLAAYNLGPQRVQRLQAEARRRGLNPYQWFFQVERVAAERHGMGVVSYVASINKYHLIYSRERYRLQP